MENSTQWLTLTTQESEETILQVTDITKKTKVKDLNWHQDMLIVNPKILVKQGCTDEEIMESNTMEEMQLE